MNKRRINEDLIARSFYGMPCRERSRPDSASGQMLTQATASSPNDKEAEAVNEHQRENGAQQTRPMRAAVARRRLGTGRDAKRGGPCGAELQKRWAWLVVMMAAGRWVAKRGVPADSSTTGRVGRLWLAPGGGSMRHDSGSGCGVRLAAGVAHASGLRRLTAMRPELGRGRVRRGPNVADTPREGGNYTQCAVVWRGFASAQ